MTSPGAQSRRWWLVSLVGLAVVCVAAFFVVREIPWPSDPMFGYMDSATALSGAGGEVQGLPHPDFNPKHRSLRLGLVGLVALLQSAFGYSEFAYYGPGLISLVGVAVGTAVFARRLLPAPLAITAGLLTAINPLVLTWASHPMPDLLMTLWVLVGLILIPSDSATNRNARFIGAGAAFAVAWTVKETAPILFGPVVVAALWAVRATFADVLRALSGTIPILVLEAALIWEGTGDPLSRIRVLLGFGEDRPSNSEVPVRVADRRARLLVAQRNLLASAGAWPKQLRAMHPAFLVGVLAPVGALASYARSRERHWMVVAVWTMWPWFAYSVIGTMRSEEGYAFLPLENGWYWHALVPPTMIGLVGLAHLVASRWSGLSVSLPVALALLLLALGVPSATADDKAIRLGNTEYADFRNVATSDTAFQDLTATTRSARVLGLYVRPPWGGEWPGAIRVSMPIEEDSSLVVDRWNRSTTVGTESGQVTLSSSEPFDAQFVSDNGILLILGPDSLERVWHLTEGQAEADSAVTADLGHDAHWARVSIEGSLEAGVFTIDCNTGPAAYAAPRTSMTDYERWDFFCEVPNDGSLEVKINANSKLRLERLRIGTG